MLNLFLTKALTTTSLIIIAIALVFFQGCSGTRKTYECNADKVIITEKDSTLLRFADSTFRVLPRKIWANLQKEPFPLRWAVSEKLTDSNSESEYYIKELEFSLTSEQLKKEQFPDSVKKDSLWMPKNPRKMDEEHALYESKKFGNNLNSNDSMITKNVIRCIRTINANWGIWQIDKEFSDRFPKYDKIWLLSEKRWYRWNREPDACESKDEFVRFCGDWSVYDYALRQKAKEYDKEDTSPYEVIDNLDSTVYRYRIKKDLVIQKPCNIEHAHQLLAEIFKKDGINIDESTEMIKFHHGLGTWIRNNWGLWSGKTRMTPVFERLKISHPDDMSGYIFDKYKEMKVLESQGKLDGKIFYKAIGDTICE